MEKHNLNDFHRGWFIGAFNPTLLPTNEFEVACKHYKKDDYEPTHHHDKATEYTLIVKGRVLINDIEYNENEIIVIEKFENADFKALEDTITVVVKQPCVANDKIIDDNYNIFADSFYQQCNNQRILLMESIWGREFFRNKTVLDLGGGVGYIAAELSKWGAVCTVYEGRLHNIEIGRKLHKDITFVNVDLENEIPDTKFDIVLNFGVFYHLNNPEKYLTETSRLFNLFSLVEGNISTIGVRYINDDFKRKDQSIHGLVKLINDETILSLLNNYKLRNLNSQLDRIAVVTGSPYDYTTGNDFLKNNYMKRTFWLVENN